jgi:hypothetical protein
VPCLVIPGRFWIVGKRFDADQKHQVDIRFDGIDALELHYRGQACLPEYGQPAEFALKARDFVLNEIGFGTIEWNGRLGGFHAFLGTNRDMLVETTRAEYGALSGLVRVGASGTRSSCRSRRRGCAFWTGEHSGARAVGALAPAGAMVGWR